MKASVLANQDRAFFEAIKNDPNFAGKTVQQGYVRLEAVLKDNKTFYQFNPRQLGLKDMANRVNQNGIEDNNIFFATRLGVFIDCRKTAEQSAAVLQTFPSAVAFAPANNNPEHLEAVYNGQLSIQVGQTVWLDRQSLRDYRGVPITQETTGAILSGSSIEQDFKTLTPMPVLSGKAQNDISVSFNSFDGFNIEAKPESGETTTPYEVVLSLIFKGYTVINAAQ